MTESPGALDGWRVLELATGTAAAFCGKVLADLGAEVLKVEPAGGDPVRTHGPRRPGAAPNEPGGWFVYLNTGKASVVLDDAKTDELERLVGACDLIVTDDPDFGDAHEVGPATSLVTITPFGLTGPYADFHSSHLVVFHSAGEGSILPSGRGWELFPDRAPLQVGSDLAFYDAGWNAAVAALGAMYDRLCTGRGQRIDVSIQESELSLNRTRLSRFTNDGVTLARELGRYGFMGMMQCRDGWVQLVGMSPDQWDALAASPDAGNLAEPQVATAASRAADPDAAAAAFRQWCADRDKADVVRILAPLGAPVGAYATAADLIASPQLAHRGFLRKIDLGDGQHLTIPGPPYRLSATPAVVKPAPALGGATGFSDEAAAKLELPPGRALAGVRILDFTWAAAGPYATCLLGFLGADIIKVETSRRPDPARRGFLADYGGTNLSPNFNELNLNKRSFQVDLSQSQGLALAHRLAASSDIVIDNFRPGVMARFGLGAEDLLAQHPGLIVVSSSANGSTGPEARAAGLASIFGATGGLAEQTGYEDGPPSEVGESTDYRSGAALAVAVIAALLHRARTGQGQHIDLASREVVVASAPDALLAAQLGAEWPVRVGNRHREHSPHNVYRSAGDDAWVAVSVTEDAQWAALCRVLGRDDWVDEYGTASLRRTAQDVIDAAIQRWTSPRSPAEATELMQAAGIPAFTVMSNAALAVDPHLAARGVVVEIDHPEIGATRVMRAPWIFSDLEIPIRPGPLLGQDNDFVLDVVLGLTEDERAEWGDVFR